MHILATLPSCTLLSTHIASCPKLGYFGTGLRRSRLTTGFTEDRLHFVGETVRDHPVSSSQTDDRADDPRPETRRFQSAHHVSRSANASMTRSVEDCVLHEKTGRIQTAHLRKASLRNNCATVRQYVLYMYGMKTV